MSERVKGEVLYSSPGYIREMLERQMPRVLRGAVPELEMVSDGVVEAMVIQLLDGANRDQRETMYHMVLERMHKAAVVDTGFASHTDKVLARGAPSPLLAALRGTALRIVDEGTPDDGLCWCEWFDGHEPACEAARAAVAKAEATDG